MAERPGKARFAGRRKWFVIGAIGAAAALVWTLLPASVDGSGTCSGYEIQWRDDEMRMRQVGSSAWSDWTYRGDLDVDAMCRVAAASG